MSATERSERRAMPEDADEFTESVRLLDLLALDASSSYGARWMRRAIGHLEERKDRELRDRPAITTERQAIALMKDMAIEFVAAAVALENAAEQLRDLGQPLPANQAKQAATRARQSAEGMNPS